MDHTNSFFATILENASPTLVTDINGRILYVNRPTLCLLERCRPFKRQSSSHVNEDPDPSSFINSHYTSIIEPLDAYEATSLRNHFMNNVQILSKRTHVCRTIKCRTFSSKRPIMLEFSTRTCSTEGAKNLILISTIRDVTDSKFQEFVLDEADHRMSITYDVMGVITEVSRSCKSILGYEPDELLGVDGYNFIHPEDTTKIRTIHAKRAVETYGTTLQRQAFRHLKKDGSYCLLELWSQGLQPDGSWSFISFDITDSSEYLMDNRNMMSDQTFIRKLLPKNVEGESRDRAANNFVSFICHELRNPLNGIIGFTSLMLDTELSEQQRDFAEAISSISSYMCNIINQSIDLCQTQSHGNTSSDIGPLRLREIVEFGFLTVTVLARNKGTELKLQDELTHGIPQVKNDESKWYGDEDIVRKILLNYLTNAIKHTGSGVVTVRLEVESDKLRNGKEGFMAKCSVEDTGPGIPQKDLKRLFLPYSKLVSSFGELKSLKEENNGTKSPNHQQSHRSSGLGLSICKELADKMGGKVGVESVLGKGSTFWFTFPVYTNMPEDNDDDPDNGTEKNSGSGSGSECLDKEKSIKDVFWTYSSYSKDGVFENGQENLHKTPISDGINLMQSSSPSTSSTTSNSIKTSANGVSRRKHKKPTKVLMVEDNEINQRIALQYLEKMGEKVTIAANGIEALEKMKNETFDILFVDLQMPYMDGYTLTRRIREAEREAEREVEREACQCNNNIRDCELPSYNASGSSTPPPTPPGSSSAPTNGHQSVIPFFSLINSPSSPSSLHISTQPSPIISNSSSSSSSSSNYSFSSSSSESSSSSYSHSQLPSPTSSNCGLSKNNVTLRNSHQPVPSSPPISPPSSHNKRHKHVPIVACTANVLDEEKGRCKQHGMDGFLSKPYIMEQMKKCIEELVEDDDDSSGKDEEKNVESSDYDLPPIKPIKKIKHYEKNLSIAPI